jgi:branched-chain amino acid transport system substrate-binding protein
MRKGMGTLAVLAAALAFGLPAALGGAAATTPGVTAHSILLGGTFPLTGAASSYAPIPRGMQAFFSYINARKGPDGKRGVGGRQIIWKYYDDAYNPTQTVQQTQRLVEQDKVFALVGGLGTEPQQAVRDYLNQKKVPQLYVSTGATFFGSDHKKYPWTIGWQPDYPGEAKIYAKFINDHVKQAKIGIFYQNDAYGTDFLSAFKAAINDQSKIVATQSYDTTATSFTQQVVALKAAGANTFILVSTPIPTITALVVATKIGWHPITFVNNVSGNPAYLAAAAKSGADVEGAITAGYIFDPNNPPFATKPPALLAKKILDTYDGGASIFNTNNIYGLASAWTFVQALKRAGNPPTRAGLMKALRSMDYRNNPWLYPGFRVKTTPTDAYPVEQLVLARYHAGGAAGQGYFGPFSRVYNKVR